MYPIFRMTKEMVLVRLRPPLGLFETHVSHHICWPWDLDVWMELNNGRTLTILDLGRIPFFARTGMVAKLARQGWGFTIAGSSVRYRKRIRVFERVRMTTRLLGWDNRFVYVDQALWKGAEATTGGLFRIAVTDRNGLVPTERVAKALGVSGSSAVLPDWVKAWIEAEDTRVWPPDF